MVARTRLNIALYVHCVTCLLLRIAVLSNESVNPSNAELNPIRHLLALAGARHFVHVSRLSVKVQVQLFIN